MYTDRFSLPFLAEVLISAAERRRPGLGAWSNHTRDTLREVFATELAEVHARFFELFDDKDYWDKVERTLMDVCFLRYSTIAEQQTELERKDYGLWRGGDLIARLSYAAIGFAVGIFVVKVPWIPIPTTWDVLIFLMGLSAPFLPDAQIWVYQRRFGKKLAGIIEDMKAAAEQQRLYQPLQAQAGSPALSESIEAPGGDKPPSPDGRIRNGG